jgi:hypothetical protein
MTDPQGDLMRELERHASADSHPATENIDKMTERDLLKAILLELRSQSDDGRKWSTLQVEREVFDR